MRVSPGTPRRCRPSRLAPPPAHVQELEREIAEADLQPVRDSLDALKRANLDELRRILRSMFAGFDLLLLVGDGAPGLQTVQTEDGPAVLALPSKGEGVAEHDGPDAEVPDAGRRYWLVPRLRTEYVEGDAVVWQPLPEPASGTSERPSSARRSAAARASSIWSSSSSA